MVGLVPKVLLDLVEKAGGPGAARRVREASGIPADRSYRIHLVYPDEEWNRLFTAACRVLDLSPEAAMEAFGDHFLEDARRRFPEWFRMSRTAREFFLRQPAIHNSFYTGIASPDQRRALQDKFGVREDGDDLIIVYRSPNRLCYLYEHMARRVFEIYGERGDVRHERCVHRGDPECVFRVSFSRKVPTHDAADRAVAGDHTPPPAGHRGAR